MREGRASHGTPRAQAVSRLVARRVATAVSLVTCAYALPAALDAQAPFTLEQAMSAPFPTELVATSKGDAVAWVSNDRGERNVWTATAPAFSGTARTTFHGDDGQEITSLAWAANGSGLAFVRGGAPNRAGEVPNPTSEPEWPDRSIWWLPVSGDARMITEGASPSPSPDGTRIAFLRGGQIWTVGLDEDAEAEQLLTIRGGAGSLRWSPDGTRLAFVSARGDHAFVGVYDFGDASLRYLAPSVDQDGQPAWSPDGSQIAFTRTPNVRSRLPFEPRREAHPWSILVADVATGEGRVVWSADPGPGSVFHGVNAPNQILWTAGDQLVFPWEKTGWVLLYAVSADGGDARLLTPGDFEVEHVALAPDGRSVVYSSNQDDIDRRHLWRVDVSGGSPSQLSSGAEIEWGPAPLAGGDFAYLSSGSRIPAHVRLRLADTDRGLQAGGVPDGFPTDDMVTPEQVIFTSTDGMSIHAQLFLPNDLRPGQRRPAAVFFHGGSRRQMLLGFHYLGYYHNTYALNQYLAAQGYVVLSVNYRSGTGYGLEFREAIDYGARGASEFNDVMGAGLYLASREDVDPERIGLWGGSYGGYLTALGLARASDLFAAGVDIHGVHDWNVVVRNFVPSYNAEAREEWSRTAFASSPMAFVDGWRSPVLLIHGDDDRNVPFSESVDLAESLRERGVEFEQLIFPDEVHGFLLHRNWLAALDASADFLNRKLQRRPIP